MNKNLITNKDGMRKAFFASAYMHRLASKQDVSHLELKLIEHDGAFKLIKWMMGLLLGGVAALILIAFF